MLPRRSRVCRTRSRRSSSDRARQQLRTYCVHARQLTCLRWFIVGELQLLLSEVVLTQPGYSPPSEEASLITRIRAGDESAYEWLYREHHEPLWRFAYTLVRSPAIAEELVHDVFLALWRDRAQWRVSTSPRLWLYGAVRNRAMNHLRHERVVSEVAQRETVVAMGAPPTDPHSAVEARELDERVHRALSGVSERRRLAMTLRWRHDFTPAEIADVLGTTQEAVRVLLTRARQDLAELVRDDP